METPLVSIIIPTYDRPKFLSQTLESIKSQTFNDYEVIVVDDGSPNEEGKLVCQPYPKVRYIRIENSGGPAKPRNTGIANAIGNYLAFVDDDDLWISTKLAKQVEILENNLNFDLVHGPCKVIDLDGNESEIIIGKPGSPDVKHGDVHLKMIGNWTLMTSSVMMRKEVIKRVGLFNELMYPAGEDTEFWTRCSFYACFYYLAEPLVKYRKHHSISQQNKSHYLNLPIHLKSVIIEANDNKIIDRQQYRLLLNQLVKNLIKESRGSKLRRFVLLFKLNPIWFLNFGNCKLFVRLFVFTLVIPKKAT